MEVPLCMKQPNSSTGDSKSRSLGNYEILKEIGEGSFSIVYHGKEKDGKQRDVAIKMCIKRQILRDKRVKYIHREKEALALLSTEKSYHPSIVMLYATFQDVDNLYFVLSYAKYGDLLHIMQKQPQKKLTTSDSRYYSAVLLDALDHIHSYGILHRDVKPENLLIKADGRMILSDFGSTAFLNKNEDQIDKPKQDVVSEKRRSSFVGTAQYVSPEMLNGAKLSPASDIWSFGVVLFQFLTGEHAFHDESEYLIFKRVCDLLYKIPESLDKNAEDLIKNLLILEQEKRFKSHQIKSHQFFDDIDFSKLNEIDPPRIYQ